MVGVSDSFVGLSVTISNGSNVGLIDGFDDRTLDGSIVGAVIGKRVLNAGLRLVGGASDGFIVGDSANGTGIGVGLCKASKTGGFHFRFFLIRLRLLFHHLLLRFCWRFQNRLILRNLLLLLGRCNAFVNPFLLCINFLAFLCFAFCNLLVRFPFRPIVFCRLLRRFGRLLFIFNLRVTVLRRNLLGTGSAFTTRVTNKAIPIPIARHFISGRCL